MLSTNNAYRNNKRNKQRRKKNLHVIYSWQQINTKHKVINMLLHFVVKYYIRIVILTNYRNQIMKEFMKKTETRRYDDYTRRRTSFIF